APLLDLTVDGADELDGELRLIKGGGGALLREKIVATASKRMVVIADASKLVVTLGRFPLPVEVVRFGLSATRDLVAAVAAEAGCRGEISLRLGKDGQPFVTDGGNNLLDCAFGRIPDAAALDAGLKRVRAGEWERTQQCSTVRLSSHRRGSCLPRPLLRSPPRSPTRRGSPPPRS